MNRYVYHIKGMSCAACVAHMERAVRTVVREGDAFTVSLLTNTLTLTCEREMNGVEREAFEEKLKTAVKNAGYEVVTEARDQNAEEIDEYRKKRTHLIISALFTLAVMYLSMGGMVGLPIPKILSGTDGALLMAMVQLMLTLPVIILNFKFFKKGNAALLHRAPNMDSLIAVGAGAAVIYGLVAIVMIATAKNDAVIHTWMHDLYFESAAMILTLVSLGKLLESRAKDKAANAVKSLATLSPRFATVIKEGKELTVPSSDVRVGDILLVRAGELFPVDGVVVDGVGAADESALTGESMPVEKEKDSPVRAACVLTSGALKVRATDVGEDTSLSRIIRLLEDAAASKAPIARIADKVSAVFVPCVMAIAALALLLWLILTGDAERALRSAISVLVISCPCALGLATPTAITVGIGRAARRGILFRNAEALERLCQVKTIVFDKTGTVTEGKPQVTDLYTYGESPTCVLQYAAAVECLSAHPLAEAIASAADRAEMDLPSVTDFQSLTANGATGMIKDTLCRVGKPEKPIGEDIEKNEPSNFDPLASKTILFGIQVCEFATRDAFFAHIESLEKEGKTAVTVSFDGTPVGIIGIADRIREDAKIAAEALKNADIKTFMLTGDNPRAAALVARQANFDGFYASLLPEDKERMVHTLSSEAPCAMVGDGINDAPALARADVGIAIGAGTEVAIDSADIVLSRSALTGVSEAYGISRATIRIIKQNLFWALFYNAICIPVAAGLFFPILGWQLSPMLGSAAMSFSSVCVVLNALRLRRVPLSTTPKNKHTSSKMTQNQQKGEFESVLFNKTKTYQISVGGMMCPRCVSHVKTALEEVKGTKSVNVSLETNSATVETTATPEKLTAAIIAAGYEVSEVKEG